MLKNIFFNFKNLSLYQYAFFLFLIGYLPIIVFGNFIQDDWSIVAKGQWSVASAAEMMCGVNNNRPLSCLYFGLLTRLFPIYQIYIFFVFFVYFIFIKNILNIFNFLIENLIIKKIFVTFLIFPFFSYTIFYSPAMQGIGASSLLFWSFSLLFLKKFLFSKKLLHLFISFTFILLMFLLYESATPLLGINLFFPLLFRKYKKFIYNFISIFFIMFFVYYLQKFVFPEIFNIDLSRIKLSFLDIKKVLFLILVNFVLVINIFFYSIEIFIRGFFYNVLTFNFILYAQYLIISTIVYFSFKNLKSEKKININKKNNEIIIYCLMIIAVIFLTVLMHVLANTGLDFIKYNNRALTSFSFLMAFIFLISIKYVNSKKKNFIININFLVFLVLLFNFLSFQNNLIQEKFENQNFYKYILNQQDKINKKINYTIVIVDYPFTRELLSYNSLDSITKIQKNNNYFDNNVYNLINKSKFCNKDYYNEYVQRAYINKPKLFSFNIAHFNKKTLSYFVPQDPDSNPNMSYKHFENNADEIGIYLENHFKCLDKTTLEINTLLRKNTFLDTRYQGVFLNILKLIYHKII